MKKFLWLFLVPMFLQAQVNPPNVNYTNPARAIKINHSSTAQPDTEIFQRTYTTVLADTTEVLNCGDFTSVYVVLQSLDTATILVKYALSVDGKNFPAYQTIDSLQVKASTGTVKSVNFTTTAGGAKFVRFILAFDTKSFSWTNLAAKKYSAYFVGKKY